MCRWEDDQIFECPAGAAGPRSCGGPAGAGAPCWLQMPQPGRICPRDPLPLSSHLARDDVKDRTRAIAPGIVPTPDISCVASWSGIRRYNSELSDKQVCTLYTTEDGYGATAEVQENRHDSDPSAGLEQAINRNGGREEEAPGSAHAAPEANKGRRVSCGQMPAQPHRR